MKKLLLFAICILFFQITKAQDEFITIWKPSNISTQAISGGVLSTSTQIWFPGRGNNYNVSWEEIGYPSHNGSLSNISSTLHFLIDFGTPQNPVAANATYRVKVSNGNGTFQRVKFYDPLGSIFFGDPSKILQIEHWGNIVWTNMDFAYSSCPHLDMTATDTPNLTNVTSFESIFFSCASLVGNSSFNNWDTSNVTDLQAAFSNSPLFNQPLSNWDTSNVTRMILTFALSTSFNQNINNWDTGNVQTFNAMFFNASAFNQPLENWDTSSAIEIELMFSGALSFNKPIGNWNTANVTDFQRTFLNAPNFNQPIGDWDTSSGIYMNGMFQNATAFNQDIKDWNTANVTSMMSMFQNATSFNQDIKDWNTGNVIHLNSMFQNATSFNQDIKNWNTSNVTVMNSMFQNATSFNQNVGKWNTGQVTTMNNMFNGATNFNQSLGSWNLSSLTSASNLFLNSGVNCQNYDSTLLGWSNNPLTPQNISISNASPLKYSHSAAVNARNFLITSKGWSITGDTYDGECQSVLSTSENTIKNEISIYPNPATDFIFVKNLPKEVKEYQITDFSGRLINKNLLDQEMINIQHLVPGNYILKIIIRDKAENFKFIKK
ncbi:BspA family leucine-rich repeat surface protein [Chryseobacterium chendengshani]|uniref:BspA family leucine-rich repeat surface protein n=1 Tax=Chryseobacterium sp. LJ668 TaxID=2864040 RepID=UPI001C6903CB|nr:BspA family leucine-rich repeat surface protein [Chryseobacterium sp. LJ668]MBW8523911.1 BspA family leucine-rich repeat surface protein [Chryseobacterium sp. LJ668]QYK16851.1 BspA family leucine-rich repeat surface protein [Chryseobacterium sp. LJ668]